MKEVIKYPQVTLIVEYENNIKDALDYANELVEYARQYGGVISAKLMLPHPQEIDLI